jgi:glycosyltransferase involved in cell wall biosynthesis
MVSELIPKQAKAPADVRPAISAVICTRNRGSSVVKALGTLLANTHPSFEVILLDQSDNNETACAIEPFHQDARLRYLHTTTKGLGVARNIGLSLAKAEIVAFTDDDCEVPPDWLEKIESAIWRYPRVALLFCNVLPGAHDKSKGFIPQSVRTNSVLVHSIRQKYNARGIGAGMAVRRDVVWHGLGGFDECLGAGGMFYSSEDIDLAIRVLLKGWWVYETNETAVVHNGFRTWAQGVELTRRDWTGIGATYAKALKCGYWQTAGVIAYEVISHTLLEPIVEVVEHRRPRGFKRFFYFWRGFNAGWHTPVDRVRAIYIPGVVRATQ